jgi:hypothetical protein
MYEDQYVELPERVYRGFYGDAAVRKIEASQRRKRLRAVFPDCISAWAPKPARRGRR